MTIRAAFAVRDVMAKLKTTKAKKLVAVNDLFAQELLAMSKAHHTFMSFLIFKEQIANMQFKCPNVKPIMNLLARIFALKQLSLDSVSLYETGYFAQGSKELLLHAMK